MRSRRPTGLTRREVLVGGVATGLLLAACGGGDDGDASAAPTDGDGGDDGTRTVDVDGREVVVPTDPRRVVAMENRRDLETAVVLGLPLVGLGVYGQAPEPVAPFIPHEADGIEVFDTAEPNLEQIAALRPDLVLSRDIYLGEDFLDGRLPDAAPVLPIASEGPWRPDLERVAAWLGREPMLSSALDQHDAAVAEVRSRHAEALASARVAVVEYYPTGPSFYAGGVDGFQLQAGTLGELGGQVIDAVADRDYFDEPLALENVGQLAAADALLVVVGDATARDELDGIELWQRMPAVAAGRVVHTDTRTNQGSVYAATECVRLLDELYATIDGR
ncbi:ABC transporter substrate-binding protein [Iamia majanohamensis]|uniref:ABC transporter substrate-binding protein n=1 Tax=Iamia majanohamensis TaxID=467976 RepID=A0AAE9YCZ5_9ACTN|nr:ABC transporter substrate-binding protein [Iamia majanohamensis]WCO68789.1 ABC transporter substrate-binding protein [Iamia majanohamensis]